VSANIKLEQLQESLHTRRFGKRVFFSREVNSTSDWAKELAKIGAEEGTVTLTQAQTAGRGRLGREWTSPKGGLWFSIVLRPNQKASDAMKLVFVASMVVAEVLSEKYGLRTETKWPNDVLVNGKKICGILAEMNTKREKVNYVILGVGVNANFCAHDVLSESVRTSATSIQDELGKEIRLESLFRSVLEEMERSYDRYVEAGFVPLLERWKRHAGFLGRMVMVTDQNERLKGLALDVDLEGALILRLEDGTARRIVVGDVVLAGRYV
jgi:BirA family biotin operon repressor/biotin-[acetyl-CoA-carboxylase] ligase